MTIFNNIFSNSDIMFYSVFAGTACLLTGSLIKSFKRLEFIILLQKWFILKLSNL
jgi:hypothetical protein